MKRFALCAVLFSCAAFGAAIDGQWTAEMKARAGKKGGPPRTAKVTMNLKSEGGRLTGTVAMPTRKRARTLAVEDGKIDGDRFSFTTVQRTKKGETKTLWEGSVQGDKLTGTRAAARPTGKRDRGRGMPFTASRQA